MFNKVIMVGNLVRDPEQRYTPSGKAVTTLRIAVSNKFKSGDSYKDDVLYIDVIVWGNQAESCAKYLNKGRQVLVEGRLQERSWEADGQKRTKVEIVASGVQFLGNKDAGGSSNQGGGGAYA
jgi:single-strand DNA-binding protein